MTHTSQQPQPHPAAPYYPAPAYAPPPPKNLTVFAVLAFATAATTTAFTVGTAAISGRATRYLDETSTLDWSVPVYGLGSLLAYLSLLAGWITGSLWLYLARKNAELLAPDAHHARRSGWAWGGWICPIVQFWFPFQIVRDVARALKGGDTPWVVGCWWAAFLAMLLGMRAVDGYFTGADAADAVGVQSASIFFAVVMVIALVLWGLVLKSVTRDQHAAIYGGAR